VKLHYHNFEVSNKKCDRTIALVKRATKSAFAQLHFRKDQKHAMSECAIAQQARLGNHTF